MNSHRQQHSMATPPMPPSLPIQRLVFLDANNRDHTPEVGPGGGGGSGRRAVWHMEESLVLLEVVRNGNFVAKICDKNAKKSHLFEELSSQLTERNIYRNGKQVECHWKHLRRTYFQLKQRISSGEMSEEITRMKWEPFIYVKHIFDSVSDPEFLLGQGSVELGEFNESSNCIKFETDSVGDSTSDPFGSLQDIDESESGSFASSSVKTPLRGTYMPQVPIVELGIGPQEPPSVRQSSKRATTVPDLPEDTVLFERRTSHSHHNRSPAKRKRMKESNDEESDCDYEEKEDRSKKAPEENVDTSWSSNMVRYEKALMDRQEKYIQYMEKVRADEAKREDERAKESREWDMKLMNRQLEHQKEVVQSVMSTFLEIAKIFASKQT